MRFFILLLSFNDAAFGIFVRSCVFICFGKFIKLRSKKLAQERLKGDNWLGTAHNDDDEIEFGAKSIK